MSPKNLPDHPEKSWEERQWTDLIKFTCLILATTFIVMGLFLLAVFTIFSNILVQL